MLTRSLSLWGIFYMTTSYVLLEEHPKVSYTAPDLLSEFTCIICSHQIILVRLYPILILILELRSTVILHSVFLEFLSILIAIYATLLGLVHKFGVRGRVNNSPHRFIRSHFLFYAYIISTANNKTYDFHLFISFNPKITLSNILG